MPLEADPKRQAVASIRGYAYQVALTSLAWLDLDEAELIIVEGAEDFDRLGHDDELNQAKALTSNLTLRSPEVLEGIQNFWNAVDANTGRKLRYRFLTTAAAGTEQGRPFSMPGLLFWQSIRDSDAGVQRALDCRSIGEFLIANKAFSSDLDGFLRGADGEEIYRRLILPMQFVMDGPEVPEIEQKIKERLVILGDKFRISAPNAEKALDTILATVLRAASSKNIEDRRLDRAALLRTFSTTTERSVPGGFVEDLQRISGLLEKLQSGLFDKGASLATTVAATVSFPPPLPRHYFRRPAVLSRIAELTLASGLSLIVGPRKIGKTLMAAAVAGHIGGNWLWIDLSQAEAAPEIIRAAANELSHHSSYTGVVVDAMPTLELHGNVGGALAILRAVISAANASLLVTANREPTASITAAAGLDPASTLALEPFSETEICLYLQEFECPLAVAEAWDSILLGRTLGEPLLLSVRIASLKRDGFPMPDISELTEPHHEVASAQRDVRLLAKQTLDERAYELLTRLSLSYNSFTREMIVQIAHAEPNIANAGSTLDSLIGPWVQQLAPDRYRISSIASTFAADEHPKAWVKDMHATIAQAILSPATITTDDAANALFQAIYGEEADVIRTVLGQFFSSNDDDLWSAFARSASLLPLLWLHELSLPGYFDDSLAALFRLTQLRISATNDTLIGEGLRDKFDSEYPIDGDEQQRITRFLGLTILLTKARGSFRGEQAVQYVQEWGQLFEIALPPDMLAEVKQSLQADHGVSKPEAPIAFLAIGNGQTAQDFESIVLAASLRGPAFVRSFFEIVENDLHLAIGFAASLWTPEVRKGDGSLQEVALSLKRSCELLLACGLLVLPDAIGNASVRVACDFGDGPEAAMKIYDDLEDDRRVANMSMLEVAHAHVLSVKEQFSGCLEILLPLLPAIKWDGKDLTLYQAYREAAACASKLDDWAGAGDLLREAAERIDRSAYPLWSIALETDAAFAYWSAERCDMIPDRLSTAASLLGSLVEDIGDWKQFMVLKRVGHTVMWMANPASASESGFSVPFAGMSSNLDTELPPDTPIPPRTPIDCILAYIVELLFVAGSSDSVAAPYLIRVCESDFAPARVIGRLMNVYRAAKIGAASGFIRLLATLSTEMRGATGESVGPPVAAPNEVVLGAFMPGLNSSLNREILTEWRTEAIDAGFDAQIAPVLDLLDRVFLDDGFDPSSGFAVDDPIEQFLSTVKYVSVSNPTVAGWLRVHGVWALFFGQHYIKEITGAFLLPVIELKWAEFSRCPFMLSSPRNSVPRLTAALSSSSRPWKKIRDILRAAEVAAGANLPLTVLTTIDRLADET